MGGYGGNLTNLGMTSSLHGKNIGAYYLAPKNEWNYEEELPNFDDLSVSEILEQIPKNWKDNGDMTYWQSKERVFFNAKDGQTNAYVKRGIDEELDEFLDRQEVQKYAWQLATDEPIIFKSGGKVLVMGREYFILKVILQQATSTHQNVFNAMNTDPENERLQLFGLKTLVLA